MCTLSFVCVHAALSGSRFESVCKWRDAPSASTHETRLTHSLLFRCHSPMMARSLTRWSLENVGAIFNGKGILSFHPCSDPVPEGTVFISAPWMPSPCEGVRLPRSTRRLRRWSRHISSFSIVGLVLHPGHVQNKFGPCMVVALLLFVDDESRGGLYLPVCLFSLPSH